MDGSNNSARTRVLELALFEKIDARLEKIDQRQDQMNDSIQDVRDKVIRIEAQDVSPKVTLLELRVRALEEWRSKAQGQVALIVVPLAAAVGALIKWVIDTFAHHI